MNLSKAWGIALLFPFLATYAFADLYFSKPIVGGDSQKEIEVGAAFQAALMCRNATKITASISSAKLVLRYDDKIIDYLIDVKNENPDISEVKTYDISEPGEIIYELAFARPLSLGSGREIKLATLFLHINQKPPQETLSKRVSLAWGGETKVGDITGWLYPMPTIPLKPSAPPQFAGINALSSGNALGVANIGNSVLLNWRTSGPGAADLSKYFNRKLSYRIYRREAGQKEEIELHKEPEHNPESNPNTRIPFTGNIEEDYIFLDGNGTGVPDPTSPSPVSDGTLYLYKITAIDDTAPEPNETPKDKILELDVVPLDLQPPDTVKNVKIIPLDNKITLKWENPKDPDLGGIMILRREGSSVAEESLGKASAAPPGYSDGPAYYEGQEPFGVGLGKVVFVSLQEDFDPTLVPKEFEDLDAKNGIKYFYKIFTYDRAVTGPPREQGKNYSSGVAVSGKPGVAPSSIQNLIALPGPYPGEIVLKWTNPPEEHYGGILIRYTTDEKKKWSALVDENAGEVALNYPPYAAPGGEEEAVFMGEPGKTYYFKAFAYNYTGEDLRPEVEESMNMHCFAQGVMAATTAGVEVTTPVTEYPEGDVYNFKFRKKENGTGLNSFAIPFPIAMVLDPNDKPLDLSTLEKLINAINTQAEKEVVQSIGWWDEAKQDAVGIYKIDYSKTGDERFSCTPGVTKDTLTSQGKAYQITIADPKKPEASLEFTFSIKILR